MTVVAKHKTELDIPQKRKRRVVLNRVAEYLAQIDPHLKEIIRCSTISFISKLLGAAINFLYNVMLARILGADGAGIYFIALTLTTFSTVLGRFGLDNTLLRYTASNATVGDWKAVKGLYQKSFILAFVFSTSVSVILFVFAPIFANFVFGKTQLIVPIRLMSLAIVPVVSLTLYGELLKGLKKILRSNLVQGMGFQTLSFIGLILFSPKFGVEGAVVGYVAAAWLAAVIGSKIWHSSVPQIKKIRGNFETKKIISSSYPLFWVSLMSLAINWFSTIFLGVWGTETEVGIFGVAYRTAMLTSFILVAVNSIAAPKFAEFYKRGAMRQLSKTAKSSARMMAIIATPVFVVFILFPEWVMMLFGAEFKGSGSVLSVLAVAQFINVVAGSVGYLLIMTGNEIQVRNSNILAAITCVILCLILIPTYKELGAAMAVNISLIARNIFEILMVRRYLGINTII